MDENPFFYLLPKGLRITMWCIKEQSEGGKWVSANHNHALIVEKAGISYPTLFRYLSKLRKAGIIKTYFGTVYTTIL